MAGSFFCASAAGQRTRRGTVLWLKGGGLLAVPPLLQRPAQPPREQGQHGDRGARTGLEQLHRIGGAAAGSKIGHETSPYPAPAGLLAAPSDAAAGPGQLLAIKQAAAGPQHPEAVLPARAGVLRAVGVELSHLRRRGCRGGGGGHGESEARGEWMQTKKPPRRVVGDIKLPGREQARPEQELNRALLRRGS